MKPTFDLLNQPWVPVIHNAEQSELNLKDVLYMAHEITAISDPLPTVEFGLYRLLIALAIDTHQFQNIDALEDILNVGSFDKQIIDNYFEEYKDRFDLFDPEHPFLQTSCMENQPNKPLSGLLAGIPSGTNTTHFHHFVDEDFAVSPAVGARLLTEIAPFMTAGGSGLSPSINGAPPWYVLINGKNLFETILFNCYVGDAGALGATGDAPPAWRNPIAPKAGNRMTKTSLLEALTWRPRLIQFVPSDAGTCSVSGKTSPTLIKTMKFRAGASCGFSWTDPNVPYKISASSTTPLRPEEAREIWRDTGPLALLNENTYSSKESKIEFRRPRILDQFQKLFKYNNEIQLTITVYGMRTDKMKVFEWQREVLVLPKKVAFHSEYAKFAQNTMDDAASVEYALKKALKHLARDDGKGNKRALDTLISNTTREYWAELRPEYFYLLNELAVLPTDEHAEAVFALKNKWAIIEIKLANRLYDQASDNMDAYGDDLQRQVEGKTMLQRNLHGIFKNTRQTHTGLNMSGTISK